MPRLALTTVTAFLLLAARGGLAMAQSCVRDTVTGEHLGEAMREALRAPGGEYDLLATTNSMRFQSAVFQNLLIQSLADHPDGGVLFIPYDLLWSEYLGVANLQPDDSNQAPIGRLRAYQYRQSIEMVYGPVDSVVRRAKHGRPVPTMAANVRYNWPDRPDGKRKFSFTDTLSDPQIRATNHQVMTLRFLVFSDMTALDDIKGISGRPLTGVLALVFKLIGEGNADFARFSISEDGQQVLRTKATKLISKTVTATIAPDGRARRGVPDGRRDLAELERRLDRDLDLDYRPFRCWEAAD